MNETTIIMVCQGSPRCQLTGDEAVLAQASGCPFCQRITIDEDGTETITEPGTA
jgi:hypothetical protein